LLISFVFGKEEDTNSIFDVPNPTETKVEQQNEDEKEQQIGFVNFTGKKGHCFFFFGTGTTPIGEKLPNKNLGVVGFLCFGNAGVLLCLKMT
jgi:hypothetical protein